MTARLTAFVMESNDPAALATFWAGVLQRPLGDDGVTVLPDGPRDVALRFVHGAGPKLGSNQMHFDLTSASDRDQEAIVDRALALGARHLDIGQGPDEPHVVLADPDDNEFCVIEGSNGFLADTAPIGALAGDGLADVGYFWAAALDWPLVWDQDEETAVQSPEGGTKVTWGGPPLDPTWGRNRLQLELATDGDLGAEAGRLVELGARVLGEPAGAEDWLMMADPGENEFRLRSAPS